MSFANNSVVALYDQLQAGYNPAADDDDHTVYAMRLAVNDTKEQKEHEDKLKEAERRKVEEKLAEEAREKARKERLEKKRQEKRAKQRTQQERKKQYLDRDQLFVADAEKYQRKDGELVVVRDVDPEWSDFERNMI